MCVVLWCVMCVVLWCVTCVILWCVTCVVLWCVTCVILWCVTCVILWCVYAVFSSRLLCVVLHWNNPPCNKTCFNSWCYDGTWLRVCWCWLVIVVLNVSGLERRCFCSGWFTRWNRRPRGVCAATCDTESDNEVSYHSRQEGSWPYSLPNLLSSPGERRRPEGELGHSLISSLTSYDVMYWNSAVCSISLEMGSWVKFGNEIKFAEWLDRINSVVINQ